jgi:tRNA/rRNA methyltransferase
LRDNKTEKDVLLEKFDGLAGCVYHNDYELRIAKKTFRQLIGRAFISGREAFTLTGCFRKAERKIGKKG